MSEKVTLKLVENCIRCGLDHNMGFTRLESPHFIDGEPHPYAGVCPVNKEIVYLRFEEVEEA